MLADRQTDRQTRSSQYFASSVGAKYTVIETMTLKYKR